MSVQRQVILILGKTGSGKSTLAKRLIRKFPRIVVFDPLDEYPGDFICESVEDFAETVEREAESEKFVIVCRFKSDSVSVHAVMLQYETAARIVKEVGDLLLVLEEAEMFIDSYDSDSAINYLISFGRHKGISILGIGRRPTELAVKLRAQSTTFITFQQSEPRDLQYMTALGFDAEEVEALERFHFLMEGEPIEELAQESDNAPSDKRNVATSMRVREQDIPENGDRELVSRSEYHVRELRDNVDRDQEGDTTDSS